MPSHPFTLITSSALPTAATDMPSDRNGNLMSEESFRLISSDLDIPSDPVGPLDEISNSATIELAAEQSKADTVTKALKTFTRPTSSGAPSIATGFQFSIAPKAQPKLTRPTKYKDVNAPPEVSSTHEQELGHGQTKGVSKQNEVFVQGLDNLHLSELGNLD